MAHGPWAGRRGPVTVAVPATSANLGPGFDSLGVALDLTDEVTAEVTGEAVVVEVTGEGAAEVPSGAEHLVVKAMLTAWRRMDVSPPAGLRLSCVNRIPHARGLGSSSAAIVAGILLARRLLTAADGDGGGGDGGGGYGGGGGERAEVLRLAAEIEGHPDNVAPCIYGGFTIAWTEASGARAVRLTPSSQVRPVVYIPTLRGLTAHARAALPERVPHADAVFNLARSALLVHALTTDPTMLMSATEDRLHESYRAPGMPATAALVADLRAAGLPAVVSGAGPSVLTLTGPLSGEPLPAPQGWVARPLAWSAAGARMLSRRQGSGARA